MSAKTIKGITVEIDGKTTKLSAAMKEAETPARSLEGSLKSVNKALKLDPTDTELVAEKQKILASYIDVTREKLETMENVQDQIRQQYAAGTIDQGAYLEFRKELEYTRSKLLDLEKQQKDFGDTGKKALKEASQECVDLSKNLAAVDKALKLDPNNIYLLDEKQKLLNDSIEATQDKLSLMKEQQEKITADYAAGDIDRGAYVKFQTELSETKQKLMELQEEQKEFGGVVTQVMSEAGSKVSEFGDKVSNYGKKLLPVTTAIAGASVVAVNAGSDMIESQNKVEVAFGDSADSIKTFAETTLDVYGIAEGTSLDMAALYGDMATSMGIAQDDAARISMNLVGLAGDLASFKNADLETVENALKGIFTGETESLKNLGVVMTQDTLLRYAMQRGMIDTSKSADQLAEEELKLEKAQLDLEKTQIAYNEAVKAHGASSLEAREADLALKDATLDLSSAEKALDESQKASLDTLSQAELVMLRYQFVLDATQNAQGDFARTSDGAANSMRVASEAVKEVAADFGTLLAPYAAEAAQMVSELLKSIVALPEGQKEIILMIAAIVAGLGPALIVGGKILSGLGDIIDFMGRFPGVAATVKTGCADAFGTITGTILPGLQNAFTSVFGFIAANPIVLVGAAVVGLGALIATKGDEIQAELQEADDFMQNVFAKDWTEVFGPVLGGVLNEFMENLKNWWDAGMEFFNGIIDFIRGVFTGDWERAWEGVKSIFSGVLDGLLALVGLNMEDVKAAFNSGIEKIKNLFNFEWNWPKLKLPHFSISGSFDFSSFPPSVPKIGVEWYAKGGILSGAQIFGALGGNLLGGGEAGPEAVLPLTSFYDNLRDILTQFIGSSSMSNMVSVNVNIEHFENSREQNLEELTDEVAERIHYKLQRVEAGL